MPDKIDVEALANAANKYADEHEDHKEWPLLWSRIRDEHFARLVMEECAKMADERKHLHLLLNEMGNAIRARMP